MNDLASLFPEFAEECADIIERLRDTVRGFSEAKDKSQRLDEIARGLHTIKGGAGMFGLTELTQRTHKLESSLSKFKDKPERLSSNNLRNEHANDASERSFPEDGYYS